MALEQDSHQPQQPPPPTFSESLAQHKRLFEESVKKQYVLKFQKARADLRQQLETQSEAKHSELLGKIEDLLLQKDQLQQTCQKLRDSK